MGRQLPAVTLLLAAALLLPGGCAEAGDKVFFKYIEDVGSFNKYLVVENFNSNDIDLHNFVIFQADGSEEGPPALTQVGSEVNWTPLNFACNPKFQGNKSRAANMDLVSDCKLKGQSNATEASERRLLLAQEFADFAPFADIVGTIETPQQLIEFPGPTSFVPFNGDDYIVLATYDPATEKVGVNVTLENNGVDVFGNLSPNQKNAGEDWTIEGKRAIGGDDEYGIIVRADPGEQSEGSIPTTEWTPSQWDLFRKEVDHTPGLIGDTSTGFDFLHRLLGAPQAAPLTHQTPLIIKAVVDKGGSDKGLVLEHTGSTNVSVRREDIWIKRAESGATNWAAGKRLEGEHGFLCPGDRVLAAHEQASFAAEADATAPGSVMGFSTDGSNAIGLLQLTDASGNNVKSYAHLVDLLGRHNRSTGVFSGFSFDGDAFVRSDSVMLSTVTFDPSTWSSSSSFDPVSFRNNAGAGNAGFEKQRCTSSASVIFRSLIYHSSGNVEMVLQNVGDVEVPFSEIKLARSADGRFKFSDVVSLNQAGLFVRDEDGLVPVPPRFNPDLEKQISLKDSFRPGEFMLLSDSEPDETTDFTLEGLGDIASNFSISRVQPAAVFFNGDDHVAIFEGGIEVDTLGVLGEVGDDGTPYWNVAGVANATGPGHTLIRKPFASGQPNWQASKREEWVVVSHADGQNAQQRHIAHTQLAASSAFSPGSAASVDYHGAWALSALATSEKSTSSSVHASMASKADARRVSTVESRVSTLQSSLQSKAEASRVSTLESTALTSSDLPPEASSLSSFLTSLQEQVNNLESNSNSGKAKKSAGSDSVTSAAGFVTVFAAALLALMAV